MKNTHAVFIFFYSRNEGKRYKIELLPLKPPKKTLWLVFFGGVFLGGVFRLVTLCNCTMYYVWTNTINRRREFAPKRKMKLSLARECGI